MITCYIYTFKSLYAIRIYHQQLDFKTCVCTHYRTTNKTT